MKNSVILVLVILVLYFIYTNLQNNTSMTGGGNEDCNKFEDMVKKLIDKDFIYSYTLGNNVVFYIIIVIFIIGIVVGIHFGRKAMFFNGIVIPGYGSLAQGYSTIDWMSAGLYKFFLVRQDMFFYTGKNSSGKSGTTTDKDQAEFNELLKDLKLPEYKPTVQYLCDKILPCSTAVNTACNCKGADPKKCYEQSSPSAKAVLDSNKKSAQHFFGIIPKCCCTKIGAGFIEETAKNKGKLTVPQLENLTISLPACSDGSDTPIIPGADPKSKEINDKVISKMKADVRKDCADVDCTKEPPYKLLEIPVYTPSGDINPAWKAEADKYPTPADLLAATPSSELQAALRNSTFSQTPGFSSNILLSPGLTTSSNREASPFSLPPINSNPLIAPPNSLTNPNVQNFTGGIAIKKESPYAKIIDEQIKRLETFKQPDNLDTLLTEPPKKSRILLKKK